MTPKSTRFVSFLFLLAACRGTQSSAVKEALPADNATSSGGPAEAGAPTDAPPKLWVDHFPDQVAKEVADADALHISPVLIDGPDAVATIGANGCPFKWVMAPDYTVHGLIYLKGDKIKHSIVTKGQPVLSAGYAIATGNAITIDDRSGHFRPDVASLALAKAALLSVGFATVEIAPDGIPVPSSPACQFNTTSR